MSFTQWISDPSIELQDLTLVMKSRSYASGRRIYTFRIEQQKFWLKFHEPNIHKGLEQAFQRELEFYQENEKIHSNLLLPYQVVQFDQNTAFQSIVDQGQGLILLDVEPFFTDISQLKSLEAIQQKIITALDSLNELHQLGWIHGDLKPDHFRQMDNACKFIDFEQSFKRQSPISEMNATQHYMAPELFHGQSKSVQSDLYAFGIILYEWMAQTKLRANSYRDWAVLHCQQLEIQFPKQLNYFLPLLQGLTQKHREYRLKNVSEAKNMLNNINLS